MPIIKKSFGKNYLQCYESEKGKTYSCEQIRKSWDNKVNYVTENSLKNTKEEAQKEFVDAFILRLLSEKKLWKIAHANEILTYENQGLRSKMSSADNMPILYLGEEEEFYQGEIREMILDAIAEKLKNLGEKTRRWDALTDVLNANDYQNIRDERERTVKILFKDYKTLSASMRQQLLELGFEITEEGKHYRLTYYGDGRYKTTIAKTGSDWREGKNIASVILKSMM